MADKANAARLPNDSRREVGLGVINEPKVPKIDFRSAAESGFKSDVAPYLSRAKGDEYHSIPVCRFPFFCSLHQLFESCAAFEQRTLERGLERLFGAGIVERHLVLTHRLH